MTTIRLWEGVGVGLIGVFGLLFSFFSSVCNMTSGERGDVVEGTRGTRGRLSNNMAIQYGNYLYDHIVYVWSYIKNYESIYSYTQLCYDIHTILLRYTYHFATIYILNIRAMDWAWGCT